MGHRSTFCTLNCNVYQIKSRVADKGSSCALSVCGCHIIIWKYCMNQWVRNMLGECHAPCKLKPPFCRFQKRVGTLIYCSHLLLAKLFVPTQNSPDFSSKHQKLMPLFRLSHSSSSFLCIILIPYFNMLSSWICMTCLFIYYK